MNITQKISNFVGGISQQPDELMPPGSVRDAVNVFPDVTNGLSKRPAGRLVQPLLTSKEGKWFNIYRDNVEQYICKVNRDGTVEVFNAQYGLGNIVLYDDKPYGTKYPELPGEGEGETTNPACNIELYTLALREYQVAVAAVLAKRTELEILLSKLDESNAINYKYYDTQELPDGVIWIKQGMALRKGLDEEPENFEVVGVPDIATNQQLNTGEKKYNDVKYTTDDPNDDRFIDNPYDYRVVTGDIWEAVVTFKPEDPDEDLEAEKEQVENELRQLEQEMDEAFEIYKEQATNCDITAEPLARDLSNSVKSTYLEHTSDDDIQVLTVNDYTFIVNNKKQVKLNENEEEIRKPENFIEVINVAYAREYTLSIREEGDTGGGSYTTVTELEVMNGSFDRKEACYNGVDTFTLTGADIVKSGGGIDNDKTNLVVELIPNAVTKLQSEVKPQYGYECIYNFTAKLRSGGANWVEGDQVKCTVQMGSEAGGDRDIILRVKSVKTIETFGKTVINPPITPTDGSQVIKASEILNDIKTAIEDKTFGYSVEIIGNGLHITHPNKRFTFDTPEAALMRVTTKEANNIAVLPEQCANGYVVKVRNTDSDFDDYWVRFEGTEEGVDGKGVWVEYRQPGIKRTLDMFTMPQQLVRTSDGVFVLTPVDWKSRDVGDDISNPAPSFVDNYIQNMTFFRNRLVMLSGENAVCSKAGDYWNYWAGSSLVVADDDPIDISASSTTPTVLIHALEVTNGLLCFGATQQHLLSTDSEAFTPTTARFNVVGTHMYSGKVPPVSLGATTGFISNSGISSRFVELLDVNRDRESTINELSKPVSNLVPSELDLVAASKDNNLILFNKMGTTDVWAYRFFQNDRNRIQSAWFRWTLSGKVLFHCIMEDTYWAVLENYSDSEGIPDERKKIISLQRFDLKDTYNTALVSFNGELSTIHLDNYRIVLPTDGNYYGFIDQTYFRIPLGFYKDKTLVAYALSTSPAPFLQRRAEFNGILEYRLVGAAIYPRVEEDNLGTWVVFDGDWSNTRLALGYEYEMNVKFPTFYPTQKLSDGSVKSDTRSSLNIHRVNLNFGESGVYETTLHRKGRPDYTQMYESTPANTYKADTVAFLDPKTQIVPVYSRNTDVQLELKSSHPSPATLYSVAWEGSYTNKFYKNA